MTASKKKVTKNAKTTSKAATKAPKKKAPAKKAPAKKTTAKKTTAKKTPAKAVTQEKEMTKALAIVPEPVTEPIIPVETEVVTEPVPVENPVEKPKKEKKAKELIKVHHEIGPSRGGKIQKRLKGNSTGKNAFGHKLRSQAAYIDELVALGRYTIPQIKVLSGARTKGRIYNHFRALKEKGHPIVNENGKIKFA